MSQCGQLRLGDVQAGTDVQRKVLLHSKPLGVDQSPIIWKHRGDTNTCCWRTIKRASSYSTAAYSDLPCTLWSLDIQYRTPSEPCFIFSVSDITRMRFLFSFISFPSALCCCRKSCSQPGALFLFSSIFSSFMAATFCCLALGPAAAEFELRFLPDMMVRLVNTEGDLWRPCATSLNNGLGANGINELQLKERKSQDAVSFK